MKKIVSLFLCVLLTISLTACSGSGKDAEPGQAQPSGDGGGKEITLTMWTHQNEPWNAAYTDAIAAF